jgi:hypothetical protein
LGISEKPSMKPAPTADYCKEKETTIVSGDLTQPAPGDDRNAQSAAAGLSQEAGGILQSNAGSAKDNAGPDCRSEDEGQEEDSRSATDRLRPAGYHVDYSLPIFVFVVLLVIISSYPFEMYRWRYEISRDVPVYRELIAFSIWQPQALEERAQKAHRLCDLYRYLQDSEKYLFYLRQCIELDRQIPVWHGEVQSEQLSLADALMRRGRFNEAEVEIRSAIKNEAKFSSASSLKDYAADLLKRCRNKEIPL